MAAPSRESSTAPRHAREIPGWDRETDVVIVGLGCAGASAAIEASRAGAEVLVLERAGADQLAELQRSGIERGLLFADRRRCDGGDFTLECGLTV